jgi:gliding motility-associated-like protein
LEVTPDTTICLNDPIELHAQASGGTGDLIVSWEGMSNNTTALFVPPGSTQYHCVAYDECGNRAEAEVMVTTDFVEPNFTSVYLDDETVGLTNLLSDSIMCFWEFSDGTTSNEHNAQHRFNTLEEWVATLHAYSASGCHQEVSQTFQATGAIYVPNTFTPNGDGINDVFKPVGRDIVSYEISVFNRFGQLVFSTNDMGEYWDGGYLGGDYFVPDGAYSFILRATDARYNSIDKQGTIIIVR